MARINDVIRQELGTQANDIQVAIKNGVVTMRGKEANDQQKQALEKQIKALPGVNQVQDVLTTESK
jgi:osmotically-inducible protein OsmY